MTWNRREVLGGLGVASAQALLWAMGCTPSARPVRAPREVSGEVRTWLRDAVSTLRGAGFQAVHALAVSRRRTIAARDVLGAGVARGRCDGVVLTVHDGVHREQITSDLSREGIAAAVRALAGAARVASVDFGPAPTSSGPLTSDPEQLSDDALLARVDALAQRDGGLSSRIVYAAALMDIDDATVWSVAPGHDREDRRVRVRRAVTRVAWNGTQPVVSEASRGWAGGVDDQDLKDGELAAARDGALALMTPGAFEDGERAVVLDPSVAADVIDAAVRGLLTSAAARRPEVARRLSLGANAASPLLTLVDDPTTAGAYGGFAFDDEGEPAVAMPLLDHGHVVGRLADRAGVAAGLAQTAGRGRRAGHVGRIEAAASHLRLAHGEASHAALLDDGFVLEAGLGAVVDPSSDRIVLSISRARELRGGRPTGRLFADLELVGDLAPLLASVTALSAETGTIARRDEVDGQPRWRSIETPWLRAKGMIRARRRPA